MNQKKILKIINNNPLLLTDLKTKQLTQIINNPTKNIFFGAGLMTSQQLSVAVPFDILSFFFTAHLLQQILKSKRVFVLVADQHALTNQILPKQIIDLKTQEIIRIFKKIITNFKLKNFTIIRTTDLNKIQTIRDIYANLPSMDNDYLKHEIADTLWLNRIHQVKIKLGWAMSKKPQSEGFDERFFDEKIQHFSPKTVFVYLKAGKTFDQHRPRVSPYISLPNEKRILLKKGENVNQKLMQFKNEVSTIIFKANLRYLTKIVRLHDLIFKPFKFKNLNQKLQLLLDKAIE